MLARICLALVAAVVAYLLCLFVGGVVLESLGVPIAVKTGEFLASNAGIIAALVALWYFFSGSLSLGKFHL
jgi:hypothetical protein